MAGPAPPSSTTLQDRLLRLAKTLQFAWFVGHVSMLLTSARYLIYYIMWNSGCRWARFYYRTAFVSALVTYGIVVYKGHRSRVRQGKPTGAMTLIQDENIQYLLMALIWLLSPQIPLALTPFMVYSIFHVATYTRSNLLPTISPPAGAASSPGGKPPRPTGGFADTIGKFIREYYDPSMQVVALLEIGLWIRIFLSLVTWRKGSLVLFIAYTAFFRARYAQSTFVQNAVAQLGARGDAQFAQQSTNPNVRMVWESVKKYGGAFVDATDLGKYAATGPGGQGPQKKAQ